MRNLSNYNPSRPELLCLRSRRTKPKIMTARPNSQSPGQVREVQARDHDGQARSRRPGEDDGQDHDGQARTTGETTTARRGRRAARQGRQAGRRWPGRVRDSQAEFATATVRSFRPIQVREVQDHDGTPFQGGKFTMRSRA